MFYRKIFQAIAFAGFLGWSTLGTATESPGVTVLQEHCQAHGAELLAQKTQNGAACLSLCRDNPECQGFYHVSGWGQCFLKKGKVKTSSLRIFSGVVRDDKGQRLVADAAYDKDYTGKDLRRVVDVKSGDACGEQCVKEPLCHAFAYFEGMRDCWLKKAEGRPYGKIFTCGKSKTVSKMVPN